MKFKLTENAMHMRRDFLELADKFHNEQFTVQDVSNVITIVRQHTHLLTFSQVSLLLDIPIDVLDTQVVLKKPSSWADANSGYFKENLVGAAKHINQSSVDPSFINELGLSFDAGNFTIEEICDLTYYVKINCKLLAFYSDFVLRIPEVTLRDDVALSNTKHFLSNGQLYADCVRKAIW